MAALSPFAFSVLSVEQAMDRDHRRSGHGTDHCQSQYGRHHRPSRRVTSNYNTFQIACTPEFEPPPGYAAASRHRPSNTGSLECERLPAYNCTVYREAKILLNLESINPLHSVAQSDWKEVFVEICGTMLNVYRCKDGAKTKLMRSYTLQHAEVGLAIDVTHTVYQPLTRFAHLIPSPARAKAHKKDPRLFDAHKQHILRLRVETDQMLFAQQSKDVIFDLIHALSAAIDIAQPLDDRSATRQCTIPRRRRRDRHAANAAVGDFTDPAFIAEQERILREMYPSLLGDDRDNGQEETEAVADQQGPQANDEDEIDMSAIREDRMPQSGDGRARPAFMRTVSHSSQLSENIHSTDPANFTAEGKWLPTHTRTEAQAARYAQRCMPVLLAEAVRASDVLICNGRRVKVNWRMDTLDDWELKPPSYRSHHFKKLQPVPLERSHSSASTVIEHHASDPNSDTDQISPLDSPTSSNDLSKAISPIDKADSRAREGLHKTHSGDATTINTLSGVVYCF